MTLMWHVPYASCLIPHTLCFMPLSTNNKVKYSFIHSGFCCLFVFDIFGTWIHLRDTKSFSKYRPTTETSFVHVNGIRKHFPKWIHIFCSVNFVVSLEVLRLVGVKKADIGVGWWCTIPKNSRKKLISWFRSKEFKLAKDSVNDQRNHFPTFKQVMPFPFATSAARN